MSPLELSRVLCEGRLSRGGAIHGQWLISGPPPPRTGDAAAPWGGPGGPLSSLIESSCAQIDGERTTAVTVING